MVARCAAATLLTLTALTGVAHATVYQATVSGRQDLRWSVNGQTSDQCEVRQGTGSGEVSFRFASAGRGPLVFTGRSGGGSVPAKATGSVQGSFVNALATPCPGDVGGETVTEPTSDCGAKRFGLRVDVKLVGTKLYVNGPSTPPTPNVSDCPFPVGGVIDNTSERASCGDGDQLWQRSWGVSSTGGLGLLSSVQTVKPSAWSKRTVRLSKREEVSCTIGSQYAGDVKVTGTLQYTITLKRL